MEQSPSSEANNYSASQEISPNFMEPEMTFNRNSVTGNKYAEARPVISWFVFISET
jgi:hypothetical protein